MLQRGRQELKVPAAAFSSTWQDGIGTHCCVGTERQELPFARPSYGASIPAAPSRQMCFTARPTALTSGGQRAAQSPRVFPGFATFGMGIPRNAHVQKGW